MTAARPRARGAVAVLAALLVGCAPDVSRVEVVRLPAPDGVLDGVVVRTDGGATTPYGYLVHVVRHGCAADGAPALRVVGATRGVGADGGGVDGVTLRWEGPRELAVRYLNARFSDPPGPTIAEPPDGSRVTVRPEPGVGDSGVGDSGVGDSGVGEPGVGEPGAASVATPSPPPREEC